MSRVRRDEAGDTLIELLITMLILGVTMASVLTGIVEFEAASVQHRSQVTLDAVLKNFAEATKYDLELQPGYAECANLGTAAIPATYELLSTPVPGRGPLSIANGAADPVTVFVTGMTPFAPLTATVGGVVAPVVSGGTANSAGNATVTFNMPTAGLATGTAATVTVTDSNNRSATSPSPFTVTADPVAARSSALVGYTLAVSSLQWWAPPAGFVPSSVGSCPLSDQNGVQQLTILATSPTGTADSLGMVVSQTGSASPQITSPSSAIFQENVFQSFSVMATGRPMPTLTESGALPSGITLTSAGVLSGTATQSGSFPITITATNALGTTSQAFTLNVTAAPTITSSGTTTFTTGTSGTFQVVASGYPAPTYSDTAAGGCVPSALPGGVAFNSSGLLSGTAAAGSGGPYTLCITASNGISPSPTQSFTLYVDQAPAVTSAATASFAVGTLGSYQVETSGYPAAMSISDTAFSGCTPSTLPTGVSLSSSGLLSGTPATGSGGTYAICVTVSNGVAPAGTQTLTLRVTEAPVITTTAAATFTVGTMGSFTPGASGYPTPGPASFTDAAFGSCSPSVLPSGVSFANGVLSGTPATGTGGTYTLCFQSTTTAGTGTQTFTLTVDQAPIITSPASETFTVGSSNSFSVTATGFPTAMTYSDAAFSGCSPSTLPSGVTLGASSGTLSGTPSAGTGGRYTLCVQASNGVGTAATQTLVLTLIEAPAITSSNSITFTTGTLGTFQVTARGYPQPNFSNSAFGTCNPSILPAAVTLSTQGLLSGTPPAGSGGVYTVCVIGTNASAQATQTFTLTIDQAPAITSGATVGFAVGTLGSSQVQTTGYPRTMSFSDTSFAGCSATALPSGITFSTSGLLSGTPAAGTGGSYTVCVQASNGVAPTATQILGLTINQPPAVTSAAATTFTVGTSGPSFTVTASGYPVPGPSSISDAAFGSCVPSTLPAGVTFTNGVLSGTPAAGTGHTYTLCIQVTTAAGTGTQQFTLTVDQAPAFTTAASTTFAAGSSNSFQAAASGYPTAMTFSNANFAGCTASTLPSGVTFNNAGVLQGTPPAGTGGTYTLCLQASNGIGNPATQTFTLTLDEAPTITSANTTTFLPNTAGTWQVTSTGFPPPTFSETGSLPSGVTLSSSGVLSGTATVRGSYLISIKATNSSGSNAQTFTLVVGNPPAITSAASTTFKSGSSSTFTVTASGDTPLTYSESGALPAGVTLSAGGVLSGTPTAKGSYPITILVTNAAGSVSQSFTLKVN